MPSPKSASSRATASAEIVDAPTRHPAAASSREPKADRRLAILLAAEKLFALQGYHAVSIRDIAAEAGVQLQLVRYYFGAKQDLYLAIFQSWQGSTEQRLAALQQASADPRATDALERIVDAFISPILALQASPEGQYFGMMAARDVAAPSPESGRAEREFFDPMAHAFIDALLQVCPGASRSRAAWCYEFARGAMLTHLLAGERATRLARGETHPDDPASKDLLLGFIAAGFRGTLMQAPAGATTKRTPKK